MDRSRYSNDMICLDRPWVLDDATYLPVNKVIPSKFYMKPVKTAGRAFLSSWSIQNHTNLRDNRAQTLQIELVPLHFV